MTKKGQTEDQPASEKGGVFEGSAAPCENSTAKKNKSMIRVSAYYEGKRQSAVRFLADMKKRKMSRFDPDDLQECIRRLDDLDPDFSRTLDLLFRAVGMRSPIAIHCISFVFESMSEQLKSHYKVSVDVEKPANVLFSDVLSGVSHGIRSKPIDLKALNLLKALGIWAGSSRNLDELDVIESLASELVQRDQDSDVGVPPSLHILFKPSAKRKAMVDMLALVNQLLLRATYARKAEEAQRVQRLKENKRFSECMGLLGACKIELQRANERLDSLRDELATLRAENESLSRQVASQKALNSHGEGELRGRARVFLEKKLKPLLRDAHEFAELDPPRKSIIVERLEMAQEEIRKEITWLQSTD